MPPDADQRWSLTRPAFERLLQRLDDDPERGAREYDVVRRRLVGFFERRGLPSAEALADETIDRVARRLEQGETVEHLNAYFYGVARHVMLEGRKRQAQELAARRARPVPPPAEAAAEREVRIACLERCLRALPEESRSLIVAYYRGRPDDRKRLAESYGITYTALKTRVFRLRIRLEECLRECPAARGGVTDDDVGTPGMRRS